MSAAYLQAVIARRSYYALSASSPIPDSKIIEIIQAAVTHSPTSFNSQSSRAVVLLGEDHKKVWDFAKEAVKAVSPPEGWAASEARLNGFQGAYGTVLLFEDTAVVEGLQAKLPIYAARFPQWADHASGILAHVAWTALEAEGLGANLQHYNPLIDVKVQETWGVPASWELKAQLVFGKIEGDAYPKEIAPIDERVKVFGAK